MFVTMVEAAALGCDYVAEWKDWAASLVPRFLGYRYFDRTLYGDVNAFISAISARFMTYGAPPPEPYDDDTPSLLNEIFRAPPSIPQDDSVFLQINSPPRTVLEPRNSQCLNLEIPTQIIHFRVDAMETFHRMKISLLLTCIISKQLFQIILKQNLLGQPVQATASRTKMSQLMQQQ